MLEHNFNDTTDIKAHALTMWVEKKRMKEGNEVTLCIKSPFIENKQQHCSVYLFEIVFFFFFPNNELLKSLEEGVDKLLCLQMSHTGY